MLCSSRGQEFDKEGARQAGEIRASLAKVGLQIGAYDVLIVGQANACGLQRSQRVGQALSAPSTREAGSSTVVGLLGYTQNHIVFSRQPQGRCNRLNLCSMKPFKSKQKKHLKSPVYNL